MRGLTPRTRLFLGSAGLLAAAMLGALFFLNQKAQQVAEAKILEALVAEMQRRPMGASVCCSCDWPSPGGT